MLGRNNDKEMQTPAPTTCTPQKKQGKAAFREGANDKGESFNRFSGFFIEALIKLSSDYHDYLP